MEFDLPSKVKVRDTKHGHPDPQCRLDTYFQGALCEVDHSVDFTVELNEDHRDIGACTAEAGHTYGVRPRCWFQPIKRDIWGF